MAGRRRSPIKIGIVDDHPVFRLGLKRALERESDLEILWELDSATNLDMLMDKSPVDMLLIDVYLGKGKEGIAATRSVTERWPEVKVAAISASLDAEVGVEMRRAGADVFIRKTMPISEMITTVRELVTSEGPIRGRRRRHANAAPEGSPAPKRRKTDALSPRQRQVLEYIRVGRTNRDIAARLGVSVATVNKHVHDILGTLGVSNRTQAAAAVKDDP